ncbi:alpha/beta fold hydrolase [Streptomyces sp. KL116D]|uniref:alpha/beta fold hydrolase n=1 Tax=Streptomyces sp. KL116D TaxID=3045152 RepID=UPI0035580EE6
MAYLTTSDGTRIFYKDWGTGRPVVLSHGWPLNSDSWEAQQLFLAERGYRAIAHDRRGHGRSTQSLARQRDGHLRRRPRRPPGPPRPPGSDLVGFSTGGGEITRYIGRHGTARVAQAVLVAAVPPLMVRRDDNPDGVPVQVFDDLRSGSLADRSQLYKDLADGPFFNHPTQPVSQGVRDAFWLQSMAAGHRNAHESIAAFSATDFRADLARFDVPTLVIHGDADQVVPFEVGGKASAALVKDAELLVYPDAPHGLTDTHKQTLGEDLYAFLERYGK